MYERFTDRARKVMQLANQEAQRFQHEYMGTEHMLLGLMKEGSGVAANVLKNLDIDLRKVRLELEKIVQPGPGFAPGGVLPHTPRAKKVIEYSVEEARTLGHNYVGTEHLLLGLLREEEGVAAQVLMNLGLKLEEVREEVLNLVGHNIPQSEEREHRKAFSKTPALDSFGHDLTELARQGKLYPCVGRAAEQRTLFEVLGCQNGPSPLLLGEAGVGKAALVAGLAQAVVGGVVPPWLRDRRIFALHVTRLWGDSDDWSGVASRVRAVFNEVRRAGDTILFMPDLIATLWVGGGGLTARHVHAELLLTVRQGRSPCILAATPADYTRCVDRWGSFGPVVQPVRVRPNNPEEALVVLDAVRQRYEVFHYVRVDDAALTAIVDAAERHLSGALPGKAVALLDRCSARARLLAWERSQPPDPKLAQLERQIDELNRQKVSAVADQEFDRAAQFRDQADRLKKERDRLATDAQIPQGTVGVDMVEEVARDLATPA